MTPLSVKMDVADSTNITGLSKLLNYDGNRDLESLERDIINGVDDAKNDDDKEEDDIGGYKKQLEELGRGLGVTIGEDYLENDDDDDDDDDNDDGDDGDDLGEDGKYSQVEIDDMFNNVTEYVPKPNSYLERVTEEQKKQRILKHVLKGVEDQKFSVEKEKEEDDKAILLEQIDMLMSNLNDTGINTERVPHVDNNSSIDDIENVHKILRLKNDRSRYCSFAEECILAGSHTLEWMFDGEKSYIGRRPDLRGWSATVNIKLRRMRYDTSTFVSDVMKDYDLGHGTRIMFELIPSLFLYSKMKKSQHSDNLITSDEMNKAVDRIRDIEESVE